MINTDRKIVCFDLEATGHKASEARIVQIGAVKVDANGNILGHFEALVNPMCRVPEQVVDLIGITNEQLVDKLPFKYVAHQLMEFMDGCDLLGYNLLRFDVPLLAEEFARLEIDFPTPGTRIYDAQTIFHQYHPRTLTAALQEYCGETHQKAHDAMEDTMATLKVFQAQMQRYNDLPKDAEALALFCNRGKKPADFMGMFYFGQDGRLYYDFGQYKDRPVDDDYNTENYALWMTGKNFPQATLRFLERWFAEKSSYQHQ